MNRSITLCAAAIGSLIAGAGIAASSYAQPAMSDAAYCRSLINAYANGGNARGSLPVGNATAVAIAQCQEGDPESAIPVLEQQMHDRRINLPPRS
jgi:hypothetical protein